MITTSQSLFRVLASSHQDFELNALVIDIAKACKRISFALRQAALQSQLGNTGNKNLHGEDQKILDVEANRLFMECHENTGLVAGFASEELPEAIILEKKQRKTSRYLVLFDPLDGSANTDLNASVGTIFSVLRFDGDEPMPNDFMKAGTAQVCAGYALYGHSTMLVLSLGQGVNGFTLDEPSGEFYRTHPELRIPEETSEFAINLANYRFWEKPMRAYIHECLEGKDGPRKKDYNMRWLGAMVADVHRVLMRGGVFMYPLDSRNAQLGGRLRLLYEVNPLAMLVEQAGGAANTGNGRILEVEPKILHQRVPVIMGSKSEVEYICRFYSENAQ